MDKTRFNYLYVFLAMLGVLLLHDAIVRFQQVAPIPYSDFQRLLREGKVTEVVVMADRIQGELKESEGGKKRFVTNRVEQNLLEIENHSIKVDRCSTCEGVWLDNGELKAVTDLDKSLPDKLNSAFRTKA